MEQKESDNIELRKKLAECDASKLQTELRETKLKLQRSFFRIKNLHRLELYGMINSFLGD